MPNNGKKIALYIPSLRGGGAERIFVILANAFVERGFEVHLVLVAAEGPYLNDVSKAVRIINLNCSRVATSILALTYYLRAEQPTVLLSAMSHANVCALFARKLSMVNTRVVVSERSFFSASLVYSDRLRTQFVGWLMRHLYHRADGIVAISSGVADDLALHANIPRERINVVYNPVDIEKVQKLSISPIENFDLMNKEGVPLILAAGRLVKIKDFSTLLKAFCMYLEKNQGKLCIIGDGPQKEILESEIEQLGITENVLMPGFLKNPYPIMRNADLFVLSSTAEAFGNVLVEAMACGTPIVSTNCPSGPSEILENGFWGMLVPVGDVLALSEAISFSLYKDNHPDVVSRAAEFGVDKAVKGYLGVMFSD